MTLPDPGTDPVPEYEGGHYRYPTLARWFGIDVLGQQIADAFTSEQIAALQEILAKFQASDQVVDTIAVEPGETPNGDPD